MGTRWIVCLSSKNWDSSLRGSDGSREENPWVMEIHRPELFFYFLVLWLFSWLWNFPKLQFLHLPYENNDA